jgi:hypothetical protein
MIALRAIALCLLAASSALSCSVPVFRYALDRWAPDRFRLEVPANSPSPQRLIDSLGAGSMPNLDIIRDAAGGESKDARLFFPGNDTEPAWTGAVDEAKLRSLVSSPARREIAKRITDGDAAVWVIVSGDAAADTVAALDKRLRYLEKAIALPKIDPNDPTSKLGPGPALAVKFSSMIIRRDDPAESEFLPDLLGPRRSRLPTDEPLLVPVFGRGRALGAWPASKMDAEQISEAMEFLCGACSCEVKALNPGWDLLMDSDWDKLLAAYGERDPSVVVKPASPAEAVLVPIPPAPPAVVEAPAPPKSPGRINIAVAIAAAVLILFLGFRARR